MQFARAAATMKTFTIVTTTIAETSKQPCFKFVLFFLSSLSGQQIHFLASGSETGEIIVDELETLIYNLHEWKNGTPQILIS
jgi:hypothetical protein